MIPIIITTVNGREEYLRQTLASVRATVPGIEPVVLYGLVEKSAVNNFCVAMDNRSQSDPCGKYPAFIVCEDDVVFCDGWYEALLREALATAADVISATSFGESEPGCWSYV